MIVAANLDWLYPEHAYLERGAAALADGFTAVELLQPHLHDRAALKAALAGLRVALINAPAGDWARGERGLAAQPGREAAFRDLTLRGLELAHDLGAPRLHLLAGLVEDEPASRATYLANLRWACEQTEALHFSIEPINRRDMPGYFLHRQAQALELLALLNEPRVQLQLDLYHCRVSEGESLSHVQRALARGVLGHVQVAGVAGRCEPEPGEYAAEWALLADWPGAVGLEYQPRGETRAGLAWLRGAR